MKLSIRDLDLRGRRVLHPRGLQRAARERRGRPTTRASARRCRRFATRSTRARRSILASHLGRPKGQVNPKYSLKPVAAQVAELARNVRWRLPRDCVGDAAKSAVDAACTDGGGVVLLENLRFHPEEEEERPGVREAARVARRSLRERRVRRRASRARVGRRRSRVSCRRRLPGC